MTRLVIIESPFFSKFVEEIVRNVEYARKCMKDCLSMGEYPFASHLLYTQYGITDEEIPEERELGMEAGFAWGKFAEATVVYIDLGITEGMKKGIERAKQEGRVVEYRKLNS